MYHINNHDHGCVDHPHQDGHPKAMGIVCGFIKGGPQNSEGYTQVCGEAVTIPHSCG